MSLENKISKLVRNQFPAFYQEEGENFLQFIEAYYAYLEQNGKLTDSIQNLLSYRDINTTLDEYIEYFQRDLLPGVPNDVLADKKLLAKYIRQFSQSRGTLTSYKLLFRSLYNENVEVNYPSDQILKVSDGDYRVDRYLITSYDTNNYKFIGKTIRGSDSRAEALVEDVIRRIVRGRDIMQILITNVKGQFNNLEPITLLTDIGGTGHAPQIECGINKITISSPGAEFRVGDIVDIVSDDVGQYGKVVVTETEDLGGVITFTLVDGGSGFSARTIDAQVKGGDGSSDASFQITASDITDTFAIQLNSNLIGANNIYGMFAPTVTAANGDSIVSSSYANTLLSSPSFGFPEASETVGAGIAYRTNSNASIVIANTETLAVNTSIFGVTSGANGIITRVVNDYGNTSCRFYVDTYKNFTAGEMVRVGTASGANIGLVGTFEANTIGYHVLQIGNNAGQSITVGQELAGQVSGSYGRVLKIVSDQANGYSQGAGGADDRNLVTVHIGANTSANLTAQWDSGPLKPFQENEGLRVVGSATIVGNSAVTTSNVEIENVYTKLSDSLLFEATTIGSIAQLSSIISGENYTQAPKVSIQDNRIAVLGIGEQYLTIQNTSPNWGTGNSQITQIDTNDRVVQTTSGATGDVKVRKSQITHANTTVETRIRVWQDKLQRDPGNVFYANNQTVTIKFYGDAEQTTLTGTGTGKIVKIEDEGVLGKNAIVSPRVGANGIIKSVRTLDSGYGYKDKEVVSLAPTTRTNAAGAEATVSLSGVANSEGYYATTRSHVSSKRGYIHDSKFYQEYSYQIVGPISLARYRDIALQLVHPAGQALYGKYQSQSNAYINVSATANNTSRTKVSGTVSISANGVNVVGTGTEFQDDFANNDLMIIEYENRKYYKIPLNVVSSDTAANLTIQWDFTAVASANVYKTTGNING